MAHHGCCAYLLTNRTSFLYRPSLEVGGFCQFQKCKEAAFRRTQRRDDLPNHRKGTVSLLESTHLSGPAEPNAVAQKQIPFSKEAYLADRRFISYATALKRAFWRRESFALARPASALVLGTGTSFVYRDGILCYLDCNIIRILDVHGAARVEGLIDLEAIGPQICKRKLPFTRVELLHYQAGMLSCLLYFPTNSETYRFEELFLVVIDVRQRQGANAHQRIRLAILIQKSKFWVRNNSRYLYVGSHDGIGGSGHREWVLQGYDLSNGRPERPLQLPDLFGSDLRQTVVFEVFDDHLYAVSNQSCFELEEIDWTSYYHIFRFPLHDPSESHVVKPQRLWRRQHREGPINDSWTDLGLCKDEKSGALLIVECRREWQTGVSTQKRTYYMQPLSGPDFHDYFDFTATSTSASSPELRSASIAALHPPDDVLATAIDPKENKPNFSPSVPRLQRFYHPECSSRSSSTPSFILAKTKSRSYIQPSSAFFDLVIDNAQPVGRPDHRQQQVRLRIDARTQASPIDAETGRLHKPKHDQYGNPLPDSEERFNDRGVRLWPRANAPLELLKMLNPEHSGSSNPMVGDVTAITDERTLIYICEPMMFDKERQAARIVLVNFDRAIRFPGLKTLGTQRPPDGRTEVLTEVRVDTRRDKSGHVISHPKRQGDITAGNRKGGEWWREEQAQWIDLEMGFQFEDFV